MKHVKYLDKEVNRLNHRVVKVNILMQRAYTRKKGFSNNSKEILARTVLEQSCGMGTVVHYVKERRLMLHEYY
jgi:hypothetical protein